MQKPPSSPVAPGEILAGKYRVEQVLGVGGMGVVVAAHHLQLGQSVALKFLLAEGLANKQVVARFEREARAAAQLRSEHVARVIDVGVLENGGSPYIVMELLRGRDLSDVLIEGGPFSESDAVDYLLQACEAIAEAHNLGIIHRDLKPKNLFVTQRVDGAPLVKVLDFGISKTTTDDLSLTGTAEIIGSPNYMSPEQLKASRDVDARSDIWSIGAILYELLGGRVPFVAETLTQLCSMVLTEPPRPLEELRPDIHPELRKVVAKCLEKKAADRYRSVGQLALALAPFASPAGSLLASRVAAVAGATSGTLPAPNGSSGRVAVPGQSTSVSWDATELAQTNHRPRRALAAGALVGALVVGGIATLLLASTSRTGASGPSAGAGTAATTVVVVAAPSAPAKPEQPPAMSATAASSSGVPVSTTTPSATTATAATPPPAASSPTKAKTGGTKVAKPQKPGGDDLPSDRK